MRAVKMMMMMKKKIIIIIIQSEEDRKGKAKLDTWGKGLLGNTK